MLNKMEHIVQIAKIRNGYEINTLRKGRQQRHKEVSD